MDDEAELLDRIEVEESMLICDGELWFELRDDATLMVPIFKENRLLATNKMIDYCEEPPKSLPQAKFVTRIFYKTSNVQTRRRRFLYSLVRKKATIMDAFLKDRIRVQVATLESLSCISSQSRSITYVTE